MSSSTLSTSFERRSGVSQRAPSRSDKKGHELTIAVRQQLVLVRKARPAERINSGLEGVLSRVLEYLEDSSQPPRRLPESRDDTRTTARRSGKPEDLASRRPAATGGAAAAFARGAAAKAGWIRDGILIGSGVLSDAWGMTPQALRLAAVRGELSSLKVNNRRYYPAGFVGLDRERVAAVTQALGELTPEEQLVFWMRPHRALGGLSVFDALQHAAQVDRAVQLAQTWAQEAGAARAAA